MVWLYEAAFLGKRVDCTSTITTALKVRQITKDGTPTFLPFGRYPIDKPPLSYHYFAEYILLKGLFEAFQKPGSTENEYVMKCVMRSFNTLKNAVMPYLGQLLPNLTQKMTEAAKNPTKPHYNHYLFESLSIAIRIVCKEQPGAVGNFDMSNETKF